MSTNECGTYDWATGGICLNLKMFGLWGDPTSLGEKFLLTIPMLAVDLYLTICALIPETYALYIVRNELLLVAANIMVTMTHYFAVIKMTFLAFKRKVIWDFFVLIKEDWQADMDDEERAVMTKYWILIKKIHFYAIGAAIAANISFHSTTLSKFVVRPLTNLTDTVPGRPFVYSSYRPFETQRTPIYELIAFNELLEGVVVCFVVLMADVLYSALVFHTCGLLDILAGRIEKIVNTSIDDLNSLLKIYVDRHVRIIKFGSDIDDLFNIFILLLLFHFVMTFCCSAFMAFRVTEYSSSNLEVVFKCAFFISYTGYLLFLSFLYCWAGESLMSKSEGIADAVYNCDWIKLSPKMALSMGLILVRSQRPMAVTAGKFLPMTLNTYAKLLKTCGGYISVMAAINK